MKALLISVVLAASFYMWAGHHAVESIEIVRSIQHNRIAQIDAAVDAATK